MSTTHPLWVPTGKDVIRPYTTTTAPNTEGKLELMIKKYKEGKMSQHIFSLKPGQSSDLQAMCSADRFVGQKLAMKGPIPKYPYKPNEFEQAAFVSLLFL